MRPHEIAGDRLAKLRGGMSQVEFGKAMGRLGFPMSRQTVWKIENAQRPLTLDELFAAAYVLGVSPLALLTPTEAAPSFEVTSPTVPDDDRVGLWPSELGDWWLTLKHPRDDVTEADMDAVRPHPVRHYFDGVRWLYDQNQEITKALDVFKRAGSSLPPPAKRVMHEAVKAVLDVLEDTTQEDHQ